MKGCRPDLRSIDSFSFGVQKELQKAPCFIAKLHTLLSNKWKTQKKITLFFLSKLLELREIYQKENWGNCPPLPGPFTENLIAELKGFSIRKRISEDEPHSKGNDLIDSEGREYEVKSTSSLSGTTSFKYKAFHQLIWLYFDFENKLIVVSYIPHHNVKSYFEQTISSLKKKNNLTSKEKKKLEKHRIIFGGTRGNLTMNKFQVTSKETYSMDSLTLIKND